jgi:rubredoxin
MTGQHIVKVNLPGGYVSAGEFDEILAVAEDAGAQHIRFGNRQQLYFTVEAAQLDDLITDLLRVGIAYEIDADQYPNIISSYVCDSIFSQDSWLKEGVYRDIFDLFRHQPKLKINIADRHQTFVPLFSGNLNFISADISNYWYCYIRFPKTSQFYCWPLLIYSDDIPQVSLKAEELILKNKGLFYDKAVVDEHLFYTMLSAQLDVAAQPVTEALQVPDFYLPYYEGFNSYNNQYWLGIYRRNELFALPFLKDLCNLCLKNRIGQIYTTPWKSLLIKGIDHKHRSDWGAILNKHRLNIRHAANELNWQVDDLSDDGLALKQQLVREFEEADLRTYRLSFVIKTRPKSGLLGSIIIKAQPSGTFEILHTVNFNPNVKASVSYKKRVKRENLSAELIALCDHYYSLTDTQTTINLLPAEEKPDIPAPTHAVYECRHCKTIYDSTYGDEFNRVAPGTAFENLGDEYTCPVCDSDKECFELVGADAMQTS